MEAEKLKLAREVYLKLNNVLHSLDYEFVKLTNDLNASNLTKCINVDSVWFMANISNSDFVITQREINVLNYIADTNLSIADAQELANDLSHDFLNEVPVSVRLFCELDNFVCRTDCPEICILNLLIKYFRLIGDLVAESDNDFDCLEEIDIDNFIDMCKQYVSENTLNPFWDINC